MPIFSNLYESLEKYVKELKCQKHVDIAIEVKSNKNYIVEVYMCTKCGRQREVKLGEK